MEITNIKEAGCNNILRWAIANGASIANDIQLQSIIDNELFYLVSIKNVNFFELFRLTQRYRNKLRITNEEVADVPSTKELRLLFPGKSTINDKSDEEVDNTEIVQYTVQNFLNLVLQMEVDNDIIRPSSLRLFLPMISRKLDIQIPLGFVDLVSFLDEDEVKKLFNSEYPANLNDELIENENNHFKANLQLALLKSTNIIKYNKRLDKYFNIIKYAPLKACKNDKLYKFAILGFHKYDNLSRSEVRCTLFNPDRSTLGTSLKRLARLGTTLEIDLVIQLPIQYMQLLLNSYGEDVLPISYESSMSNILDTGIIFNDFMVPEFSEDDEERETKIENFNNAVEAYKVRVAEANQVMINSIGLLLKSQEESDIDISSVFAMLPSVYMSKGVITVSMDKVDKYMSNNNPVLSEMFSDIFNSAKKINEDINNAG